MDPSFPGVSTVWGNGVKTVHTGYFLLKNEIKDYNIMNDRRNVFDQPVKNDLRTYDYIGKIIAAQEDDYTNGYLLDDTFFKKYYKIAMNLSTQKTLDADPSAIKQKNEIKEI